MAYKDLVPVGTALITCATSFGLGVIYANLPYDFYTLWRHDELGFAKLLAHYQTWGNAPMRVHHILHGVIVLGLVGCFIKLYKPHPDVKYFEYGTLAMLMVGIVVYLTNMRIGVNSCLTGQWGDVDFKTGINVMAASQFIAVVALVGVLVLQGGLYYAEWQDAQTLRAYYEKEARKAAVADAAAEVADEKPQGKATGVDKKGKATGVDKKAKAKKRA